MLSLTPMKLLLFSILAVSTACLQAAFDHSHADFTAVLKKHVSIEKVDYAALKKDPDKLGAYLVELSQVPKGDFDKWDNSQKEAFLINLYNASTLKLIVDHYPVKSIKDIGSPWGKKVVKVFGNAVSLDKVEKDMLLKTFKDPRIHFGVNCASIGCPALRAEAFQAARLDKQLAEQGANFLRDTSKNRVDAENKTLYLSHIFDWYAGDFKNKSGSVEKFVAPYFKDDDKAAIKNGGLKIKYTDYDWNLNKQ